MALAVDRAFKIYGCKCENVDNDSGVSCRWKFGVLRIAVLRKSMAIVNSRPVSQQLGSSVRVTPVHDWFVCSDHFDEQVAKSRKLQVEVGHRIAVADWCGWSDSRLLELDATSSRLTQRHPSPPWDCLVHSSGWCYLFDCSCDDFLLSPASQTRYDKFHDLTIDVFEIIHSQTLLPRLT